MEYINELDTLEYLGDKDLRVMRPTFSKSSILHSHGFYEMEFIVRGKGRSVLNGKKINISRGSISLITPKDFHLFNVEEEFEIINIIFTEKALSESMATAVLMGRINMQAVLSEEQSETYLKLVEILEESLKGANREFTFKILESMIVMAFSKEDNAPIEKKPISEEIERAMKYVDLHFRDNPSLSEVSAVAGKSPEYFSKIFKKQTGIYYADYLNGRKVKCAKLLLTISDMSMTDICYECGFNSGSNFQRVFKEITGETPSSFRKTQQK